MNPPLPSLFVPHGAPTFALNPGAAGAALATQARSLPAIRAIVMVSAHNDTAIPRVGFAEKPETIHDFGGFPEPLYRLRYPASGCPEGAERVARAIEAAGMPVQRAADQGLDHGAWVPLLHMFPDAEIPVIPLSLQSRGGTEQAYRLGWALSDLKAEGFLIMGSGSITHNLRDYQLTWRNGGQTPAYVRPFADWLAERLAANDIAALLDYRRQAPGGVQAHPSEEHLLPFYVALGAAGDNFVAERFHRGIDDYVIAMDAYSFLPQ